MRLECPPCLSGSKAAGFEGILFSPSIWPHLNSYSYSRLCSNTPSASFSHVGEMKGDALIFHTMDLSPHGLNLA